MKEMGEMSNDYATAFHDGFPATPGHALIIHKPPQRLNPGIPGSDFFPGLLSI